MRSFLLMLSLKRHRFFCIEDKRIMKNIQFKFVSMFSDDDKAIVMPKRMSARASGFDLVCAQKEPVMLMPAERVLVKTGIALCLPMGLEAQVRSRSGLALKGIAVFNSPGTIDADYRGEIKVILANFSKDPFIITFGMRIAQLVIASINTDELVEANELVSSTRGEAGFGSTGA